MSDSSRFANAPSWAELNELNDAELLTRLVAGDHRSLAVLFDRYHRLVFSVAVRILRDEGEAEEVVQTVFLNIFQDAVNFDPLKGSLKIWLLQYAYHRSLNRRRGLLAQGVYLWDKLDNGREHSQSPDLEALRFCEQMLMRLKPAQRQVFELTYLGGWTAQEIAAHQNRPVAHVRHDLYRGLTKLRSLIAKPAESRGRAETALAERRAPIVETRTI